MTRRQSGLILLSIVVAALAIWLWLRNFSISADAFSQLFVRLRWWPVLPLFCLLAEHVALSSWRWSLIEVGLGGGRPRFSRAFAAGALSLGLGTFLPPPVVNVVFRSLANRVSGTSGLRGVISGGIDQMADLATVVLVSIPAVIAFVHHDLDLYFMGAAVMVLLGLVLILTLPAIVRRVFPPSLVSGLNGIAPLIDRPLLLKLYGISLLRVANLTLMTLAIHVATGTATVTAVVIGVPLVTLAISAAMLPGALGVSEWSFSAVFSSFGVARGDIVLFVLANRIVLTGLSLTLALLVFLAMARALLGGGKEA
jgi:Lysylphosphatidylglycerol synthase TM region